MQRRSCIDAHNHCIFMFEYLKSRIQNLGALFIAIKSCLLYPIVIWSLTDLLSVAHFCLRAKGSNHTAGNVFKDRG